MRKYRAKLIPWISVAWYVENGGSNPSLRTLTPEREVNNKRDVQIIVSVAYFIWIENFHPLPFSKTVDK